ncbi:ion channel [Maribacter sp. 2307ULW6-5]|uniref:ion channel n=1 Tax=Maribacter sp. 2307ULW6-5 TaxID=3386275 RepID=UPI0039BCE17B
MMRHLYPYRFELLFTTLLAVLFGSLLFPTALFQEKVIHLFFLLNIIAGVVLVSKSKRMFRGYLLLLALGSMFFVYNAIEKLGIEPNQEIVRLAIYTVFYVLVTIELIRQVWRAKKVGKNVMMGLMSAYLSLGLISFLFFFAIELFSPGSFSGNLIANMGLGQKADALLYYSYVTMLTIGYGDIVPITPIAQKATMLCGLVGQFYIVIVTAVVVEKYIVHSKEV